jgi:arylsulfatase A-like enzyme
LHFRIQLEFNSEFFMKNKKYSFLIFCFAFQILVSTGCQKTQTSQFKVFRFIDHLQKENIIASPFKKTEPLTDELFPIKSSPMNDLGTGENPYQLKRKLRQGSGVISVLFAPPETHYRFETDIPEESILEFSIGITTDENSVKKTSVSDSPEDGVVFLVTMGKEAGEKIIFQEYLHSPPKTDNPSFTQTSHSIQLPRSPKKTCISIKTKGEKSCFSYWINPVIYKKQNKGTNVILISIDTLRADHLGCYGYERDTSPHIDKLASEGALFINSFSTSPWTLPSHVSIMTSLYGIHHQVYYSGEKIAPSVLTLADLLRKNDFFTCAFTGGGFVSAQYGFAKGFDAYYEGRGGVFHMNSAELIYDSFSNWIDNNRGKRFFLFLHTYQPHNPYVCPHPYNTRFLDKDAKWEHVNFLGYLGGKPGIYKTLPDEERKNAVGLYDGEISYLDEKLIGPLVTKLKETSLYEKTMIIFTSDHGEEFFDHKAWDHGHSLYNESIRVPLIIKFPKDRFNGMKIPQTISLVDIMPTILEEIGIECPDTLIDGKSLFSILKGRESEDRTFLADIGANVLNSHIPQKISMNKRKYKLILNKEFSQEDRKFFIEPPPEKTQIELFDLLNDFKEENNIAEKNSALTNEILQKINEIYSQAKKGKSEKTEIDEKLKEQLKALGYIH